MHKCIFMLNIQANVENKEKNTLGLNQAHLLLRRKHYYQFDVQLSDILLYVNTCYTCTYGSREFNFCIKRRVFKQN